MSFCEHNWISFEEEIEGAIQKLVGKSAVTKEGEE
jgi:hypothetical protein